MDGRRIEQPNPPRAGKRFKEHSKPRIDNKKLFKEYLSSEAIARRAVERLRRLPPKQKKGEEEE